MLALRLRPALACKPCKGKKFRWTSMLPAFLMFRRRITVRFPPISLIGPFSVIRVIRENGGLEKESIILYLPTTALAKTLTYCGPPIFFRKGLLPYAFIPSLFSLEWYWIGNLSWSAMDEACGIFAWYAQCCFLLFPGLQVSMRCVRLILPKQMEVGQSSPSALKGAPFPLYSLFQGIWEKIFSAESHEKPQRRQRTQMFG